MEERVAKLLSIGGERSPDSVHRELGSGQTGLLRARTEEAARGLLGAPTCTAGDELFWGNDRLEAAVEAATGG